MSIFQWANAAGSAVAVQKIQQHFLYESRAIGDHRVVALANEMRLSIRQKTLRPRHSRCHRLTAAATGRPPLNSGGYGEAGDEGKVRAKELVDVADQLGPPDWIRASGEHSPVPSPMSTSSTCTNRSRLRCRSQRCESRGRRRSRPFTLIHLPGFGASIAMAGAAFGWRSAEHPW